MRPPYVRIWRLRRTILGGGLNGRERRRESRSESFAESLDTVSLNCGWNRVTVTLGIFYKNLKNDGAGIDNKDTHMDSTSGKLSFSAS